MPTDRPLRGLGRPGTTAIQLREGIWVHPSSAESQNEVLGSLEVLGASPRGLVSPHQPSSGCPSGTSGSASEPASGPTSASAAGSTPVTNSSRWRLIAIRLGSWQYIMCPAL